MRSKTALALIALLVLVTACTSVPGDSLKTEPPLGLLKVKCDVGVGSTGDVTVTTAALDPIVYHRVDPADTSVPQPHEHDLFGNESGFAYGNNALHKDLLGKATQCRIPGDTAAYWTPSLRYTSGPKAGQRVAVRQLTAYYRGFAGQTVHAGSQAIPAGARLVAPDMVGYGLSGWTCGANSTVIGGQNTIPDCSGEDGSAGNTLTAHVNFPSCWNGVAPGHPGDPGDLLNANDTEYGDTRDNADFIYPTNKTACPASHPIEVVQLREAIQYFYTGNGTDVALSSDNGAAPGSTYHADFWNTWDQASFVDHVQRCIRTSAEPNCEP